MSFATTMIWFIGTAVFVLLLLGLGFPAAAGMLHMPGSRRRAEARAAAQAAPQGGDAEPATRRQRGRFHLHIHASH